MILEKGMCVSADNVWYVVVKVVYFKSENEVKLFCICDNANNIYSWDLASIHSFMTLREIAYANDYPRPSELYVRVREIPRDVVIEVLAGIHDDRFDHWLEDLAK